MQVAKKIAVKNLLYKVALVGMIAGGVFVFLTPGGPPTRISSTEALALAASDAIATVQGDGRRVLHVFVSADCAYCKKIEPELDQLRDVTIYRHLVPRHNAEGRKLALDVWCAADKDKAWGDVTRDRGIALAPACDGTALDRNRDTALKMGLTVTPSIITGNGAVGSGMMSADDLELQLLQK